MVMKKGLFLLSWHKRHQTTTISVSAKIMIGIIVDSLASPLDRQTDGLNVTPP